MNKKMPILFIGHGSPMNAIEDNIFTKNFSNMASKIDRPKAILCISAHWVTKGLKVTAMDKPRTIHDFYGFPEDLYQIDYPANGDINLAKEIRKSLSPYDVKLDKDWGLDHGTWSILKYMYPDALIPVVQLSLDYSMKTQEHFDLAKKLSHLRSEGILIIGSGNIIHNLSEVDFNNMDTLNYSFDWAKRIHKTLNMSILSGDYKKLINYDKEGEDFMLAIPTPEHFWPLIYILGLKEVDDIIELWNDTLVGGSLSMTALKIYEN